MRLTRVRVVFSRLERTKRRVTRVASFGWHWLRVCHVNFGKWGVEITLFAGASSVSVMIVLRVGAANALSLYPGRIEMRRPIRVQDWIVAARERSTPKRVDRSQGHDVRGGEASKSQDLRGVRLPLEFRGLRMAGASAPIVRAISSLLRSRSRVFTNVLRTTADQSRDDRVGTRTIAVQEIEKPYAHVGGQREGEGNRFDRRGILEAHATASERIGERWLASCSPPGRRTRGVRRLRLTAFVSEGFSAEGGRSDDVAVA